MAPASHELAIVPGGKKKVLEKKVLNSQDMGHKKRERVKDLVKTTTLVVDGKESSNSTTPATSDPEAEEAAVSSG